MAGMMILIQVMIIIKIRLGRYYVHYIDYNFVIHIIIHELMTD